MTRDPIVVYMFVHTFRSSLLPGGALLAHPRSFRSRSLSAF